MADHEGPRLSRPDWRTLAALRRGQRSRRPPLLNDAPGSAMKARQMTARASIKRPLKKFNILRK
jgi:hypothetical protein